MGVIHRKRLEIEDWQMIWLCLGDRVLTAQPRHDTVIDLWYETSDVNSTPQQVEVAIVGTGHESAIVLSDLYRYLSTVQIANGQLVFHVYVKDFDLSRSDIA